MGKRINVAVVGLGRMGLGVVERLLAAGHRVTGYDVSPAARAAAKRRGAKAVDHLAELMSATPRPRILWLMLPAGRAIDDLLFDGPDALAAQLSRRDVVVDGGNSHYRDSMSRAARLHKQRSVRLLDCGTSGGVQGRRAGYCLMVSGDAAAFRFCRPVFTALAARGGYARVGPSGAGHYVKMVHNAIEYAMLQSLGEGFSLLAAAPLKLDPAQVAELWTRGSVIRSHLVELAHDALARPGHFEKIAPKAGGGQTGAWAVQEARRLGLAVPAIALALKERKRRPANEFAARLVAALRWEFGRHPFETKAE